LKTKCQCQIYAKNNDSFNGREEIIILSSMPDEQSTFYQALCSTCGRSWLIRELEGYHYPIYSWSEEKKKNSLFG
jgi:hypothetical protein